jgi:hypothetical protein
MIFARPGRTSIVLPIHAGASMALAVPVDSAANISRGERVPARLAALAMADLPEQTPSKDAPASAASMLAEVASTVAEAAAADSVVAGLQH